MAMKHRHLLERQSAIRPARSGTAAIWVPWLVAPLFVMMPMGGCALAERCRQIAALDAIPASPAPVEAVVQVVHGGAALSGRPVARTVAAH